ncbi:MAG: histidinol-phosphatase [Clostridia bacterium]|nr:histidinol-phosphatase [Clostridia bacterium]
MDKYKQNLHTHTKFCDGHNTIEEMVKSAINSGFTSIGFSAHSPDYLKEYCLLEEDIPKYVAEVKRVKEKYKEKIKVFLGMEYDYYSNCSVEPFEYVIGAVHYIETVLGMQEVDTKKPEHLKWLIENCYNNNPLDLAKFYFGLVKDLPNKLKKVDIVAHLDLLLKSNEIFETFNTNANEYREIVLDCVQSLINKGLIFEVNTGAIARGLRKEVYPQVWVLKEIAKRGGKVLLSSDCHYAEKINFYFDEGLKIIKDCGFNEIYVLTENGFIPQKI